MTRIALAASALALAVFTATAASAQVKLGVAGPLTGGSAAFGAQLKNGVEQAVEDINAAGGILGQKIVLSAGDDRADPKEGVSVANKFVGDGVKFVVGHFNSGVTIPSSEVYQENGMLVITPAATNPKVTERNMWNVFRVCGRDDQQGGIAGEIIAKKFAGKRVAVVHDKTTYGQGLADETRKAMNAKGIKEVFYEGVNKDDKDFTALISKLKQANPDLVYWGGLHDTGGLIVRQMRDQGLKAPLMGGDGITDDEFAAIAGPGAEGTLMTFSPRSAHQSREQGHRRSLPHQAQVRAAGLHALQLRRRAGDQAGRRRGEVARTQESRGRDALGQGLQDRAGRHLLRQEGRRVQQRLHGGRPEEGALRALHLEEGSGRQDLLLRGLIFTPDATLRAPPEQSGGAFSCATRQP